MSASNPQVDAYIERAEPFARPILRYLREVVHEAHPGIEETIKWGMPYFVRKGNVCGMAAFQAHCAFGFWKGEMVLGDAGPKVDEGMGQFGRITAVEDLPPRAQLLTWVRRAVELNEKGVKAPRPGAKRKEAPPVELHPAFEAALQGAPAARASFDAMRPSHRREYALWIAEAKRDATREKRIATALTWIQEGKSRNWKYET